MLLSQILASQVGAYATLVVASASSINAVLLVFAALIRARAQRGSRLAKRVADAFPVFFISMPALTLPIARNWANREFADLARDNDFWLLASTSGVTLGFWFAMCALWISLDKRLWPPP